MLRCRGRVILASTLVSGSTLHIIYGTIVIIQWRIQRGVKGPCPKQFMTILRIVVVACTCMSFARHLSSFTNNLCNYYGIINCRKFSETRATRWLLWHSGFTKFNFGRGFAQDPAGRAYDVPPNPSRLGRGYPIPILHPSTPSPFPLDAFGVKTSPRNGHWRCPLNPISGSVLAII